LNRPVGVIPMIVCSGPRKPSRRTWRIVGSHRNDLARHGSENRAHLSREPTGSQGTCASKRTEYSSLVGAAKRIPRARSKERSTSRADSRPPIPPGSSSPPGCAGSARATSRSAGSPAPSGRP